MWRWGATSHPIEFLFGMAFASGQFGTAFASGQFGTIVAPLDHGVYSPLKQLHELLSENNPHQGDAVFVRISTISYFLEIFHSQQEPDPPHYQRRFEPAIYGVKPLNPPNGVIF